VTGVWALPYFTQYLTFCSVARRPKDRLRIGHTRPSSPSLSPPLRIFSFFALSNYSLVSSPAGRSFFEKTTQARTRPTPHSQKLRSLTHPNRRYSSTFVSIPSSLFQVTPSLFANFLFSTSVCGDRSNRPLNLPSLSSVLHRI
jgi:hypothetical protein